MPEPDRRARGARARAAALLVSLGAVVSGCEDARSRAGDEPQRIIAVAPSVVEVLYELGLGERVVGVGDWSRWPPEVESKPRIGGLFDPRLETIAALGPDLAILLPGEAALAEQLDRLGVEVLTVDSDSLGDVETAVTAIAGRCGVEAAGEELLARFRAGLAAETMSPPRTVALVVGRRPKELESLVVAGPGTFLDELVTRLGAVNVFGDAALAYPQVGLEALLDRQPNVLIELQGEPIDRGALLGDWQAFPQLEAVGRGCVDVVIGNHVLIPGPRLPRLYGELRERITACKVTRLKRPASLPADPPVASA